MFMILRLSQYGYKMYYEIVFLFFFSFSFSFRGGGGQVCVWRGGGEAF